MLVFVHPYLVDSLREFAVCSSRRGHDSVAPVLILLMTAGNHSHNTSAGVSLRAEFETQGLIGPIKVFEPAECRQILQGTRRSPPPDVWFKGHAASSRAFYELATRTDILHRVAQLLGEDIMLWGASLIAKRPGEVHQWHTDLESSTATSAVTVWIGLDNTSRHSSLHFMARSHRFGISVQQVAHEAGKRRDELQTEDLLRWARARDPLCQVVSFDVGDGEAVMFDGRLWHGSRNTRSRDTRTALLLQYATPDTVIRIPDPRSHYEWPFRFLEHRKAPCIMVRGTDHHGVNRIVAPPDPEGTLQSTKRSMNTPNTNAIWPCWISTLEQAPEEIKATGWSIHPVFGGSTSSMQELRSHFSVLSAGTTPHLPHTHEDEELIVVLSGEVDIVTVSDTPSRTVATKRIASGSVVYHSSNQCHTIRSVGPGAATYLIFKWKSEARPDRGSVLQSSVFDARATAMAPKSQLARGFSCVPVLDSPTLYLTKLHCHISTLQPGAGYAPHRDPYDVAIVVLSGAVETLGQRVGRNGVIFYPAGELHGMQNSGTSPATYLVFEFHGDPDRAPGRSETSPETIQWQEQCASAAKELATLAPDQATFILVDDGRLRGCGPFQGFQAIPFLERGGQYWGRPSDDETANRELERLRDDGARLIVFAWPAFWWLDHYAGFERYLRSHFACVCESDNLVAFDLEKPPS